jgi:hypothetical protein
MAKGEPPSARRSKSPVFLVGKNRRGNWVVQDVEGLCGGFFVDREQALKFVRLEAGRRAAVSMVAGTLELDMSSSTHLSTSNTQVSLARAA